MVRLLAGGCGQFEEGVLEVAGGDLDVVGGRVAGQQRPQRRVGVVAVQQHSAGLLLDGDHPGQLRELRSGRHRGMTADIVRPATDCLICAPVPSATITPSASTTTRSANASASSR